jgi:hypothetical protein
MFHALPRLRMLWAVVTSIALTGCGGAPAAAPGQTPVTPPSVSGGSVRLDSATAPAGEPRHLTVSGAVNGTNPVSRQACESSGTPFRHFALTTDGNVAGRLYFLSISVYPYAGPGAYELRPLAAAPNPLLEKAPSYPGFLNFVPKSRPGNAYSIDSRSATSTMAVDAGEASGWIDVQMVAVNQAGEQLQMRVSGRFVCGLAFTPFPEMSPFS